MDQPYQTLIMDQYHFDTDISVILCDTDIEVYEDHLSKIQSGLAKVLLEMLHGDMLLDVGQRSSNLFPVMKFIMSHQSLAIRTWDCLEIPE